MDNWDWALGAMDSAQYPYNGTHTTGRWKPGQTENKQQQYLKEIMRVSIRRSERTYYGYGQGTYLACWNDYASTGGLLSTWKWHIEPDSGLEIDSLIWHRENSVYYTCDEGIDIEVESFTFRKPGWITLTDGCGLCVPADHRHRIRSRSNKPVRLQLMRVPASDEDRRQVIELAEDIRPDLSADPLPDYRCAPFVERLSELKDVQLWPGLKPFF